MKGKFEGRPIWFSVGNVNKETNEVELSIPLDKLSDTCDKGSTVDEFLRMTNEDPKFVVGTLIQLWNFARKASKGETWDDLTDEVGLTSDEFNFLMCIEDAEGELRRDKN